jgi:hypothetical protein
VGGRRQDGGEEPELAEAGGDGMEGRSPSWWSRKAARWRGGAAGEDGREEWPAGMICSYCRREANGGLPLHLPLIVGLSLVSSNQDQAVGAVVHTSS